MKKAGLIAINFTAILIGILFAIQFTQNAQKHSVQSEENSFLLMADSMKQISTAFLEAENREVCSWADYIAQKEMTAEQAAQFLAEINTNDDVSAQIIDPDTLKGLSVESGKGETPEHVSYVDADPDLRSSMQSAMQDDQERESVHFTHAYIDPMNGMKVIGFLHRTQLTDEVGDSKPYLLIRTVPAEAIRKQWALSSDYKKAAIGIIDRYGNICVPIEAVNGSNLLGFLEEANDLTQEQTQKMAEMLGRAERGLFTCKGKDGVDLLWVYTPLDAGGTHFLIGCRPAAAFGQTGADRSGLIILFCILLIPAVIDLFAAARTQKRLRKAKRQVEAADQEKMAFLSSLSHDVRTPMNAIIGLTVIAEKSIDNKVQVKDCLRKISLSTGHLLNLITDVLDITRVENDSMDLNPMVFHLADLTGSLMNIVYPVIREKSQQMDFRIQNIIYEDLYADELRINQIFLGLLRNAVQYTGEGGQISVLLTQEILLHDAGSSDASLEDAAADESEAADAVSAAAQNETADPDMTQKVRLIYQVRDNGVGISRDYMNVMYDADAASRKRGRGDVKGAGLSLAITRKMIDKMGGTIDCVSEKGKGTTFTVTLDLPTAHTEPQVMQLPAVQVLVCGDDAVFQENAKEMLSSLGAFVVAAECGLPAVQEAAAAHRTGMDYPVILIDRQRTGMGGIELAKTIRAEIDSEDSAIVLASYDWSDIEEDAKAAGINGFINKPMFRSDLYEMITEMLRSGENREVSESEEDLVGLHFLIAEDNTLNWEVVSELLEMWGMTSDRAENGAICIEMLEKAPDGTYDGVFMDVQMPVMNGLEATRVIRASERPKIRNIPVIAMTAATFREDIEFCFDAGMNGHVSKPVDMRKLIREIRKHVKIDKR